MIGSFWNLCRACPSMPVDKLHSEYRSTYRWHEYTGGPDVVRKPPVPNQFAANSKADHFFSKSTEDEKFIEASINEPPLPRRKKCPELAYRTNEFLATRAHNDAAAGHDRTDTAVATHNRARSEERGTPSRRSKSEGPPAGVANGRLPTGTGYVNGTAEPPVSIERRAQEKAGESSTSGLFKKTISKLSTEYRLQFVWPHVRRAIKAGSGAHGGGGGEADGADALDAPPRKSLSMGALKAAQIGAAGGGGGGGGGHHASVHKKRTTNEREATATELEPLVSDCDTAMEHRPQPEKREMARVVEQKVKALREEKEKFGFEPEAGSQGQANSGIDNAWYKEVLELRKKAGEYRNRGWGVEMNPDLFNKQVELWDQVSRRSSLSALSLASTVRPITKEEKEKENNKKSSPTKPFARGARIPGSARPVEIGKPLPDALNFSASARSRKEAIRHHLERTTGVDVEDGALLPSPTREKLMPTIPRSKADSPQRGSPQKTALSRHGSPQKGSPQKSSPKKMTSKGRSQSVGPAVAGSDAGTIGTTAPGGSPKRQIRSGSTVAASTASSAAKTHKKTPTSATAPAIAQNPPQATQQPERRPRPTAEDGVDKESVPVVTSAATNALPPPEILEQIIKSPPEPTRVKSPEQIIMRSPDPVNWTVPLDTGKTFTVTQNVRDGDPMIRPHSEIKASTPVDRPPPPPQSAPPELSEQSKMPNTKLEPSSIKESEDEDDDLPRSKSSVASSVNPTSVATSEPMTVSHPPPSAPQLQSAASTGPSDAGHLKQATPQVTPAPEVARFDKPVPGSTLRCLEDPAFESDINSPVGTRNVASEVLDKARDRFDRFWGNPNEKPEQEGP
ncbi:pollen-specific leucine-rich repeat extensin-like protein 2 isoform X5 [Anopheles albimanus]|uniref:pollen-specific leucine-rich repeat extensin-like protein 2 isoform X5 n=1 Tax=Anopheles albimanus TaxID=7167 RepID=UPI001641023F|nr:pollen-specific leucine-rich repeat extensin-like protein 2 isoform X5 [Anopheles albimanus]